MPDNVRRWISAGEDMALVGKLMTDGYSPAGIAGSIANGQSEALRRMYGVKTTPIALPEPTIVNVTGDDTRLGVFTFDSENAPTFTMTTGEVDQEIAGATQGTEVYTIGTYYDIGLLGPIGRDFPDMLLWVAGQAKSRVSGNKGAGFHNLVIPRCTMTYLGRPFEERSPGTFSWQVAVDPFDTFPWGGLLANDTFGKSEGYMFEWFTNKRPQFMTIVDDENTNEYQLPHTPWTDGNGNVRFIAWRAGEVIGSTANTSLVSVASNKTVSIATLTGRNDGDKIYIFSEVA